MVLTVANFKLHHSLRKTLKHFARNARCEIRFNTAFRQVIQSCANAPRRGHNGTWIVPAMVDAYTQLHAAGLAHSVETWIDGELAGGLYCVALGHAVFGESMFANRTDASKIALAALVAFCRAQGVKLIDCQQNTTHLASMGAAEIPRAEFVDHVQRARTQTNLPWHFDPLYWNHILGS
jgi:leucyl/phenylalanyl-tRNA--protein transferase